MSRLLRLFFSSQVKLVASRGKRTTFLSLSLKSNMTSVNLHYLVNLWATKLKDAVLGKIFFREKDYNSLLKEYHNNNITSCSRTPPKSFLGTDS